MKSPLRTAVFLRPLNREMAKSRKHSRRAQRGGGFAFDGPAFQPAGGMAPEASRTGYDECTAVLPRPPPQVGGGCMSCGAVMDPSTQQRGGGSGSGGYMPILSNELGKFHAGYLSAPCPAARQVGGGEAYATVSYPAGYGYETSSPFTTPSQSAHFLEPHGYGKQCMGGGSRRRRHHRTRRNRRSQRRRTAHRR